jgi:hypothetical protein
LRGICRSKLFRFFPWQICPLGNLAAFGKLTVLGEIALLDEDAVPGKVALCAEVAFLGKLALGKGGSQWPSLAKIAFISDDAILG